jgi:hypothetical protein
MQHDRSRSTAGYNKADRIYWMQSELKNAGWPLDRFTSSPGIAMPFLLKDFRGFGYSVRPTTESRAVRVGETLKNEAIAFVDRDFFKVFDLSLEYG